MPHTVWNIDNEEGYLFQYIHQVRTGLHDHPVPVATAKIDRFMFD